MYLVRISEVKPGQVLAKAVVTGGGAVLCPAGFRLTETSVQRLANAGIESLLVEGDSGDTSELQRRMEAVEARFRGIDDPIMMQIKATVEQRLKWLLLERGGAGPS